MDAGNGMENGSAGTCVGGRALGAFPGATVVGGINGRVIVISCVAGRHACAVTAAEITPAPPKTILITTHDLYLALPHKLCNCFDNA